MSRVIAALAVAAALASAPAHAGRVTPETTALRVPPAAAPGARVDVLVIDHREDVLAGDEREDYEGVSREHYGIPLSRATYDRTPLAAYLGQRLRIGFDRAGYAATFAPSPKGSTPQQCVDALAAGQARAFVVDLRDWHYDLGGLRSSFFYDVTVSVYDAEHRLLASKAFDGEETMPTIGWNDPKLRVVELYRTVFDRIFATDGIHRALDLADSPVATAADHGASAVATPAATGQHP